MENYSGESWNPLRFVYEGAEDVDDVAHTCPQPSPNDAEELGNELVDG